MAPVALIPNGVYKLRNGQYTDYVADLIDGVRGGPISAYKENPANRNDKVRAFLCGGLYSPVQ